jgi:hypothetical protein
MANWHPRIDQIEAAFSRFCSGHVDLGEATTAWGRQQAKGIIQTIEVKAAEAAGCPNLVVDRSFIAGSLGRRTQEQPLDDVDSYLVLNAPGVGAVSNGAQLALVATTSTMPTPLVDDLSLRGGGYISAELVLQRIAGHLQSWFPDSGAGISKSRKTCFVKQGEVNFDLAPVVHFTAAGAGIDQYWMPFGAGSHGWKPTNPRQDQKLLSESNQDHDGELLKIIRFMKWWNRNKNRDLLKGIHLEVLVQNALAGTRINCWAATLELTFERLAAAIDGPCPDPTGLGDQLDKRLSQEHRQETKVQLQIASLFATKAAREARKGNIDGAMDAWQVIAPLQP